MKSISQKLQDDIRAIMEAGLHPNQQKIDVHEPEKDKITAHDFKKLRAMKKTPDGKVHNCATHVEHVVLGKGTTVSEDHAEPDAEGNIEWYTVQFEHSTQQVLTKDLTITMSEAHMHESSEEQVDEEEKKKVVSPFDYKNYKSQIPTKPGETAGFDSKKISTGTVYSRKPVKEEFEQLDEIGDTPAGMEKVKAYRAAVGRQFHKTGEYDTRLPDADRKPNPFHAKDAASMPNAANKRYSRQTGAARAKKIETGTRYEEAREYTFADYLDAVRSQYGDEDAVLIANEAFKNKDITLFNYQSQSPEA